MAWKSPGNRVKIAWKSPENRVEISWKSRENHLEKVFMLLPEPSMPIEPKTDHSKSFMIHHSKSFE